jgi:hypothetical protein
VVLEQTTNKLLILTAITAKGEHKNALDPTKLSIIFKKVVGSLDTRNLTAKAIINKTESDVRALCLEVTFILALILDAFLIFEYIIKTKTSGIME